MTTETGSTRETLMELRNLVVFRNLLDDDAVSAFARMLDALTHENDDILTSSAIASFEALLFESTSDWTAYLRDAILENDNLHMLECAKRLVEGSESPCDPTIEKACSREIAFLSKLGTITLDELIGCKPEDTRRAFESLPRWIVSPADYAQAYAQRVQGISTRGYGIFARHVAFTIEEGALVPVRHPDPQRLSELPGYERERQKVIDNTKALLAGLPANNVLLYGDAGTGKSSAIKAIVNEYADEGLRLVEVKRRQLYELPEVMDALAANPLKFIIFIDDLSFVSNDDDFAALKAILEGSVTGRARNIAVYATSNRRHLVKETLSDRAGDDIHEMDTRQEMMSLSARFGLTVTFQRPDKQRFIEILLELARQAGLSIDEDELVSKAEAFAMRSGGRSPRVARQLIDLLKAGVQV